MAENPEAVQNGPLVNPLSFPRPGTKSVKAHGIAILKNKRLNKDMAFTLRERQVLGIHGLLPPAIMDQDEQVMRAMANLEKLPDDLSRYMYLSDLQERNEKLFYRVLVDNVHMLMPIVYTPTVGLACQLYGFIFRKPKGLYISIHDFTVDNIYQILKNWPENSVKAIVVTDGERILGLGDLGVQGMGIPVGKLALYVALAGVRPRWCLPITLDVGTNNEKLLKDPFYTGFRHRRVTGEKYDQFIDNFMKAVVRRFGQETLIQFEDFANHNAFRLLEKYKEHYCTFNDDIQGTAAVGLAGLMAAARVTQKLSKQKFLFYGAGEASIGIAYLTCLAMQKEGLTWDEAKKHIFLIDSKGLVVQSRTDITEQKRMFAQDYEFLKGLENIVKTIKPTALIGAAAVAAAFTEPIVKAMALFNEKPIIFALSNPTSKAECTAEQCYTWTNGKAVYASGSPFPPCEINGKTLHPGQGNNAYIFPGVALGTIVCGVRHVTDEMFLVASETLASLVTEKHLDEGRIYPPLDGIREISIKIGTAVAEHAYKNKTAGLYPEPVDKEAFIRKSVYKHQYANFEPPIYDWPPRDNPGKL